jgi:hypothetical protein
VLSFDDFLLSCVGFCEPMVSIIKDKIEFSSEFFFYFKRLVNHETLFQSHVSRRWANQETLFLSHVSRRWTKQETLFPSHVSRRWVNQEALFPRHVTKVSKPGNNVCYGLLLESGQINDNCFR